MQMLATLLVFGIRTPRSAGCTRSAQVRRTGKVLFGLKIKRAGRIIVSTVRIHPYNQINGRREITISKAAPRLAQWIVPIACSEMDDSRSSQRARGTRSGHVGFSAIASAKGEGFMSLNIAKPRTPTASKAPKLGPATSRHIFQLSI
jgi:hypothetical protein